MVKPGDASMAAAFTAKDTCIMPCTDIIKQGRCTLVTTVQMFKILGLMCLSTAYSLSVMYLEGVKLGDLQVCSVLSTQHRVQEQRSGLSRPSPFPYKCTLALPIFAHWCEMVAHNFVYLSIPNAGCMGVPHFPSQRSCHHPPRALGVQAHNDWAAISLMQS